MVTTLLAFAALAFAGEMPFDGLIGQAFTPQGWEELGDREFRKDLTWLGIDGRLTVGVCRDAVQYHRFSRVVKLTDAGAPPDAEALRAAFDADVSTVQTALTSQGWAEVDAQPAEVHAVFRYERKGAKQVLRRTCKELSDGTPFWYLTLEPKLPEDETVCEPSP